MAENKTRVFCIDPVKFDTTSAAMIGQVVQLYNGQTHRPSIWQTSEFTAHVLKKLDDEDFDVDHDCLLIAGPMVTVAIVVAALASEFGALNLVLFDPSRGMYVLRKIGTPFEVVEE